MNIPYFLPINKITLGLIILFGIVIFGTLLFLFFRRMRPLGRKDRFEELFLKIREEIKYAVAPKSIQLSQSASELIDLAVEVWRMEQRILKSASNLPESQLKGLENSVQKLKRYLEKYDVEIIDYKNQKYNEGLNLDVLSVEKDTTLSEPMIKETIEPTIICKGQVVRKAKIILINNH